MPSQAHTTQDRNDSGKSSRTLGTYLPTLDGWRTVAIALVLFSHASDSIQNAIQTALFAHTDGMKKLGLLGVQLFFGLSGFLITSKLIDEENRHGRISLPSFYTRRAFRILPASLMFLGVAGVLALFGVIDVSLGRWLSTVLFAANYTQAESSWYLGHFWSLAVEEHFYFVWPLFVWLLAAWPRRLMWASLGLSVAAMTARLVGNVAGLSWWTTYVLTPFRLDGLALGAFLAMLARQPGGPETIVRWFPRVAVVAGVLTAGTYAWVKIVRQGLVAAYSIRASLVVVLLATVLIWALVAPERSLTSRFFRSRWLMFFGTYSYGIYVYHHFFSYYMMTTRTEFVVQRWVGWHFGAVLLQALVAGVASIAVAYASYHLYEKRFLGLKRYFEPGR